jgi:uncharacterized membrane protein YdbT with pleckstrin-like domain
MSYINDTLLPGEKIRYSGHVHWIIFVPCLFLAGIAIPAYIYLEQGVISGVLLFLSIVSFLRATVYYLTTELGITNQRIIAKFGFIRRVTFELNINRIMSLNVQQSVFGRIFDYGDLFVNGIGGVSTPVPVIADPLTFRRMVLGEVEVNVRTN